MWHRQEVPHDLWDNIPVWVRFRSDEEIVRAVETCEAAAGIVSNFGYDWYRSRHPQAPLRAGVFARVLARYGIVLIPPGGGR